MARPCNRAIEAIEEELEERLEELTRKLTEVVPPPVPANIAFKSRKGKLPWPVAGRMVQRFGESMKGGVTLEGIVIESEEGEDVRAVHGGDVVFADWLRGYGLMLIVDHGDGFMTLYGYNQSLLKGVGDPVEAGEIVSLAGVSPSAFSIAFSRVRSSCSSSSALRMPTNATPTTSRRSTCVIAKVRSKISSEWARISRLERRLWLAVFGVVSVVLAQGVKELIFLNSGG